MATMAMQRGTANLNQLLPDWLRHRQIPIILAIARLWAGACPFPGNAKEITFVTLAGTAAKTGANDGAGYAARFDNPSGLAVDNQGLVWVADSNNHLLRKIDPQGNVITLAGSAGKPGSADGLAIQARFNAPSGVAVDRFENVWVADASNHTLRKIDPQAVVITVSGRSGQPGSTDGVGAIARFNFPAGVAVDGSGNVYVADFGNHTVRQLSPAGETKTLAGTAGQSGGEDGAGPAARLNNPTAVAVDTASNVYVADYGNHTIRRITPSGRVTTVAGQAGQSGSSDGPGTAARFNYPSGIAVDPQGRLFVADSWNHVIRLIDTAGNVTTIGGQAGKSGNWDGTGPDARFYNPQGIAVDTAGHLYVADTYNQRILKSLDDCADAPWIDVPTGRVGLPRQLDATPRTAASWSWAVLERPPSSTAIFSSADLPNPIFTPDAPGNYIFQLSVTNASGAAGIRTLAFTAIDTPLNLEIVQGLQDLSLETGETAFFRLFVDGTPPLTFQWKHNGGSLRDQASYALILTNIQASDAGEYSVLVSDRSGASLSSTARLTVRELTWFVGKVTDAISGQPLAGATVRAGAATAVTDANGEFTFSFKGLETAAADFEGWPRSGPAPLTVQFYNRSTGGGAALKVIGEKDGYISYTNMAAWIQAGTTNRGNLLLYPRSRGLLELVLTWGDSPRDLDAHLLTPSIEGQNYEVQYANGRRGDSNAPPFAQLDHDVKNGFGPEISTLFRLYPGSYRFFVHNYKEEQGDTGNLKDSQAMVQVYRNQVLLQSISVPNSGEGDFWDVATIDGNTGELRVINQIHSAKPGPNTASLRSTTGSLLKGSGSRFQSSLGAGLPRSLAESDGSLAYFWDFGDGTTATKANPPPKVYRLPGAYTVTLSITNSSKLASILTKTNYILATTAMPELHIRQLGSNVEISWSITVNTLSLVYCDNISTPDWQLVRDQLTNDKGIITLSLPVRERRFFRLMQP